MALITEIEIETSLAFETYYTTRNIRRKKSFFREGRKLAGMFCTSTRSFSSLFCFFLFFKRLFRLRDRILDDIHSVGMGAGEVNGLSPSSNPPKSHLDRKGFDFHLVALRPNRM